MHNEQELSNLSQRLAFIMNKMNVSQAELARLIGVKPQVIHYLCNSASKKSSFTYDIANALQISSLWLACGTGSIQAEEDVLTQLINNHQQIPVLDWQQMKNLVSSGQDIMDTAKEWILVDAPVNKASFAFRLSDKSLFPRLEKDTLIIINTDITAKNKDFVLVYLSESEDIIFRQYELENNKTLLKPFNTELYKIVEKKPDDIILGVMVEARWQLHT